MQIVEEIEKLSDQLGDRRWADLYNKKYVEEVLSSKYGGLRRDAEERGTEGRGRQQLLLLLEKEKPVSEKVRVEPMRRGGRSPVTPLERPIQTALTSEVQQVLTPETRIGLVQALRARAEAVPEATLTPELRQTLARAQGVGQRLTEIGKLLKTSQGVVQLLKKEIPQRKRRLVIPTVPQIPTEISEPVPPFPKPDILKTPESDLKYSPLLLTTTVTPTTSEVPTPTYTPAPPVTVSKISEVPVVDVPTVPTYTPASQPKPLPSGWWRHIPPSMFVEDAREGAYRVQEGKRQILALA
jgi:hypothetical protein